MTPRSPQAASRRLGSFQPRSTPAQGPFFHSSKMLRELSNFPGSNNAISNRKLAELGAHLTALKSTKSHGLIANFQPSAPSVHKPENRVFPVHSALHKLTVPATMESRASRFLSGNSAVQDAVLIVGSMRELYAPKTVAAQFLGRSKAENHAS